MHILIHYWLLRLFFYWRSHGDCFSVYLLKITPHNEWQLIKNNNMAASLAFSGTLLGYVIPLSSAAINAVSIPDYFAWGGIALVIQLIIYGGVRLYMPALSEKIINHNTAAGLFMGTAALAGGIFNAACMTW
jgi:putative membrane protein